MARKSVTKSKPATKQLLRKYQSAGPFSPSSNSTYQQVVNPYYISGTFAQQAGQEADRYYSESARFGDYAQAQNISAEVARKEEQAREEQALKEYKAQSKAANQAETQQAATDALSSGTDLAKTYFKQQAIKKATEQAATNTIANAAMQAGTAGVWAPVASAATPTAASVGLNTLPTMGAAYVPAASTATTAGTSLLPGAVEVGSQVGQAAAGAGTAAGSTAGTAAGTGASAASTGASIGTGLATAGIGLGLNIGGTLLENSGDDNDYTTFTKKEKNRNLAGSAMKSAGTGVGVGAAIGSFVPGIGTVIGAGIGGLVGGAAGLIKGIGENKESKQIAEEYKQEQERIEKERAEAERKRLAELNKQGNLLANRYNTAFVNSRLTGLQTGFGYNTSTNMNMQPTSSFYAKTGGSLPGGHVVPIGDDAVKFVGRKHSEGGIKLDAKTEVEGGETMDKVMMNGGKPNDYFFSAYLKLGGKSFAKRHEELVKTGASQAAIQDLAKKQEAVANKKGEKDRGPEQIAKYGGIHQYKMAGPEASAMAQSNMDAANVTLRDTNKANAEAPSDQQSAAPGKRTTNSGMLKQYEKGGKKQLPPSSLNYIDSTPWSSAFISYVYSNADPEFPKSPTHTGYATGLKGRDDWEELDPATTKLQPGDIIVNNRSGNKQKFGQDSYSGFSHGDIVTKIEGGKVYAIGGNVDPDNAADNTPDTVAERTKNVKDGILADTGYFVVLRPKDPQIAKKAVEVATNEKQLWETNKWNEHADTSQARLQTYYQAGKLGIPGVKPDDGKPAAATAPIADNGKIYTTADGEKLTEAQYRARQTVPGTATSTMSPIDYALLGIGRAIASGTSGLAGAIGGAWEGFAGNATAPSSAARPAAPTPNMAGRGPLRLEPPKPGTEVGFFKGNVGPAKPTVPVRVAPSNTGLVRQPPFYTEPNYINVEGRTIGLNKTPAIDNQMFKQFRIGSPEEKAAIADKAVELPPLTSSPRLPVPEPIKSKDGTLPVGDDKAPDLTKKPTLEEKILEKETADKVEKEKEREKTAPPRNKSINGALLAGLGQLIPVGYALARPYKTEGNLPRMEAAGNVGAGSVKGAVLPRVNMNAERAAAERNTVAINNAIQNTNAGPGGIAAMMAANASQNNQMLNIANQEQEANKQLAAQEATLGQQASMSNAEMAQRANMANVQNRLAVNQANLEAGIQEARLKLDEKRYKREEVIGALDTAAGRIAGIYKDDRSYKAQERLANAMDDAGSYQRFQYYEDLKKQAKDKDSEFYGKTDKELRDYAAQQYNDYIGTAKTGGARKYTSRLGQLSKGKKTFNI